MKIVFLSFLMFLAYSFQAQNEYIEVNLEDGSTLRGILGTEIVLKGFKALDIWVDRKRQVIPLERIKKIATKDKIYFKQGIRYQSLDTDILIASFVRGSVNLYEGLQLNQDPLFFIQRGEEAAPRLINRSGNSTFLNYFFSDCSSWEKLDRPIPYKKRNFIAIATKYSNCFAENGIVEIGDESETNSFYFELGGILGGHNSRLSPILDEFSIRVPEFTKANSVSLGGLIKVNKGKYLSLEQDFMYSHHISKADYSNFSSYTKIHAFRFKLNYLEFVSLLKFTMPDAAIQPHIGFGIYNGFYLSSEVEKNKPVDRDFTFDFDTHSAGVLGTIGASYRLNEAKKVGVEYRFIRYTNYVKVSPYGQIYDLDKRRHFVGAYIHTALGRKRV
ncbi:MAG: hypothetical protein AAF849_22470 [Bacteroidota bacterium]